MSESMIRASLDQALLAIAATEGGTPDLEVAQAHALIAQALATVAATDPVPAAGPFAGGPGRRNNNRSVADQWRDEIEVLAVSPVVVAEPVVLEELPVGYRDESPAQRRRRLRDEANDS